MFLPVTVRETFPENWPDSLKALSFPTVEIAVTPQDTQMLGSFNGTVTRNFKGRMPQAFSPAFHQDIEAGVAAFSEGVMPRLGLCSWKGSTLVHRPARTIGAVMQIITQNDPRIGLALGSAIVEGKGVVLHLRAWRVIPEFSEFRIFIKNGDLIGASQYRHRRRFHEIARHKGLISNALNDFVPRLLLELHLNTVVADVWMYGLGKTDALSVQLIELNPFDPATDPCLFDWTNGGNFDDRLRLT
jgi:hypothetical protein